MRIKVLSALFVASCLLVVPASAHHGSSFYDLTKTVASKVTVTSLQWENPHCTLNFDIRDEQGVVAHWSVVMENPSYMSRAGWSRDTLKAGDEITISFHPAKNGRNIGYIRQGDGKVIFKGRNLTLAQE